MIEAVGLISRLPLVPAANTINAEEHTEPIPTVWTGLFDLRITSISAKASCKEPPSELI